MGRCIQIESQNLREAKQEVMDEWVNTGEKTIIEEEWKHISSMKHTVNTDYGK